MIDIDKDRRLTGCTKSFVDHLLAMPVLDDEAAAVLNKIEAARKQDLPRETDFDEEQLRYG